MSLVDPTIDITFKRLFGTSTNKDFLIDFLNRILKLTDENKIIDLFYQNTELIPVTPENAIVNFNNNVENDNNQKKQEQEEIKPIGGRMNILINPKQKGEELKYSFRSTEDRKKRGYDEISDVACICDDACIYSVVKTKSNQLINIEIEVTNAGFMGKRSLYYASGVIFHSLPAKALYCDLPNLIMINILNYNDITSDLQIIKRDKEYLKLLDERCHSIYNIREKHSNEEEIFNDTLTFHFIELKKFLMDVNKKKLNSEQYSWIEFLLNPSKFEDDKSDYSNKNLYAKAFDFLKSLEKERDFIILYNQRLIDYKDFISAMNNKNKKIKNKERIIEYLDRIIENKDKEIENEDKEIENMDKKIENMDKEIKEANIKIVLYLLKEGKDLDEVKKKKKLSEDDVDALNDFLNGNGPSIEDLALKLNINEEVLMNIFNLWDISLNDEKKVKKRKI